MRGTVSGWHYLWGAWYMNVIIVRSIVKGCHYWWRAWWMGGIIGKGHGCQFIYSEIFLTTTQLGILFKLDLIWNLIWIFVVKKNVYRIIVNCITCLHCRVSFVNGEKSMKQIQLITNKSCISINYIQTLWLNTVIHVTSVCLWELPVSE